MGGVLVVPYGVAFDFVFPAFSRDGSDLIQPTWAAGDAKFSKDGAAVANTPTPAAFLGQFNRIQFTAPNMAAKRLYVIIEDQDATDLFADDMWEIQTKDSHLAYHVDPLLLHAGAIQASTVSTITLESPGPTGVPNGTMIIVESAGGFPVKTANGYVSGTRVLTVDNDYTAAPTVGLQYKLYRAPQVPVNVPADIKAIDGSIPAAQKLSRSAQSIITGAAVAGQLTVNAMTTTINEGTSQHFKRKTIVFVGGVLDGQITFVSAYALSGGNGLFTFDLPVTDAPVVGQLFALI